MPPAQHFVGPYRILNVDHLRRRAAKTHDPRHVFYEALLSSETYEAYLQKVGEVSVSVPTYSAGPISGRKEIAYVRRHGWIVDGGRHGKDREVAAMATEDGQAWSAAEIEACLQAYLAMLDEECAGRPYTKVDFNKEVQAATGRSKGSVDFKFGNISAILGQLGLRWIQGYKPAPNAQAGAIRDALDRLLAAQAALAKRLEIPVPAEPRAPLPNDITSVFTDPPSKSEGSASKAALPPGSNVKKFDRALTDAKNRDLGRAGEEFVLTVERERLREEGRADLADNVTWISEEQGDGAGYDIASFNEDGSPRLIEVKTTNGAATTSFLVTANEVEVSRANPDHYWLYRVYDLAKKPRIYCVKGSLDDGWRLEPAVFRARR